MTLSEMIAQYSAWENKLSAYRLALGVINFDRETIAPTAGATYRDERSSFLAGEYFTLQTDKEIYQLLTQLAKEDLKPQLARKVQLHLKEMDKQLTVPKDEYVAYDQLLSTSALIWRQSKQAQDYAAFEPYLKKVIAATAHIFQYRKSDLSLYDRMLDDYETGMTMKQYDQLFSQMRQRLVPLLKKVTASPHQPDTSFLNQSFEISAQKEYMEHIKKYLGYQPEWGYQGESAHPFTDWNCINDVRTTTRYIENDVVSGILSTVHEIGHAFYAHDTNPEFDGSILLDAVTSGMHESQSRLAENYLGRSLPFWQANYPQLQKTFGRQLHDVSLEKFVSAINVAKPSLIRTEADELTYPLHIMIRYELEKGLFDGSVSTDHLDSAWNEMYQKYLGIQADKPSEGILQDVHWAEGLYGYFPTYALGSAYAAQFYHKMRQDIDVDACLSQNHYDQIIGWLTKNIHQYGALYEPAKVMEIATGEPFNPTYYLDYLEEKYIKLYQL
jgi:carboxypeptidase Taq